MESLPSGICYRHWPVDNANACVLLAHGLAEHAGRYAHVAARFNERGVVVVGPDHVGHGASPGIRVFLRTFSEYLEPMLALRGLIEEWYPGQPVFLFGHSMGGLISAHLLLESQAAFRGAMLGCGDGGALGGRARAAGGEQRTTRLNGLDGFVTCSLRSPRTLP